MLSVGHLIIFSFLFIFLTELWEFFFHVWSTWTLPLHLYRRRGRAWELINFFHIASFFPLFYLNLRSSNFMRFTASLFSNKLYESNRWYIVQCRNDNPFLIFLFLFLFFYFHEVGVVLPKIVREHLLISLDQTVRSRQLDLTLVLLLITQQLNLLKVEVLRSSSVGRRQVWSERYWICNRNLCKKYLTEVDQVDNFEIFHILSTWLRLNMFC